MEGRDGLAAAVRAECEALDAFLDGVPAADWSRPTVFHGWTVADQVMHLHLVDLFGLDAMRDPEGFKARVQDIRAMQARGVELSAHMRERFGHLSPAALRATWRATYADMCDRFAAADPRARMPWFGPDMSILSFASARQMEVWAHGQDIYDLFHVRRPEDDRIRNICELGVRTFGWSFRNRALEPPGPAPRVVLAAPSGAEWRWNAESEGLVAGTAADFALVVTQRRHVDDTGLRTEGAAARRWMEIAQCFAGAPADPPARGERRIVYPA